MNKHLHIKRLALFGIAFTAIPATAFAAATMTGNLGLTVPGTTSLWPVGGLGGLAILSLARVSSWRNQMAKLRRDLDVEIAERREVEKTLREKEQFIHSVLDANPAVIFVKDRQARYTFVNQAAAVRLGGNKPEDIIGKPEAEVLPNRAQLDQFHSDDLEVMDTLREKFISQEAVTNDKGETRWFQTVKRPLISSDGKADHVLGVCTDITERKQVEAQLASERQLLHVLMDNSPDNIYFKDIDSRFIACSKALCNLFGKSLPDIVGKTDFDFFSHEHAQRKFDDEQAIIRTGQPLNGKVELNLLKDGSESWSLTAKMPLRDESGKIIGTCGISKDFTAIKQAEAKLEQVHRQFVEASRLAGMAEVATSVLHNVGNVLNSVNVSTAVVSEKIRNSRVGNLAKAVALIQARSNDLPAFFASDPKGQQLPSYLASLSVHLADEQQVLLKELATLNSNIEHIKEIVTMQQSYAKISGMVETLDVVELVEDALRMNSGAMQRHQVHIYRDFADAPPISADKHKILQILVNLIRNAKYALDEGKPAEKRLTLRITAQDKNRVKISVIDNGIGIPAENLTQIFGHGFTTRKDGHGFGLHSGALAAKEMGGALIVQSEGLGQGATFTLELPCKPESEKL